MLKRCEVCGAEYEAARSTARFCSARCRKRKQRACRARSGLSVTSAPSPLAVMSEDEMAAVVQSAHSTASDLARAAAASPAEPGRAFFRVSNILEAALRGEGL